MKDRIIESLILSIGLIVLGYFVKQGIESFHTLNRVVSVKGLAEMEVEADRVIWPIVYKDVGNDLNSLYDDYNIKNNKVILFLRNNGIDLDEISTSAPKVIDLEAERYSSNTSPYRYNLTSVITVSSNKVDLVRKILSQQGELLKQGVAVIGSDYEYNIQYSFTKLNDIKPQMIESATKNAREAALKFAEDSNSKLGKIKTANQGQFSIYDRDDNTPHIKNVRIVSTVEYYLKD